MTVVRSIVELVCDNCRTHQPVGPYRHRADLLREATLLGWRRVHYPKDWDGAFWLRGKLVDLCPHCYARWRKLVYEAIRDKRRDLIHGSGHAR